MKRFLLALIALLAFAVSAAETSTLSIAVNISGPLTADDKRALQYIIGQANVVRLSTNGTALPTTNAAALKTSYEQILSNTVQSAHASYMSQAASTAAAKELIGDDAVSALITKAVIDAIVAGKTVNEIITAITK